MTTRTSKRTVTFRRPFILGELDEKQPAGAYIVETDEELLEGISFPAYRRIATLIRLHAKPGRPGITQTLYIDPKELEAALLRDAKPAPPPVDNVSTQKAAETSTEPRGKNDNFADLDRSENEGMPSSLSKRSSRHEPTNWR
jgi:hypothetical protein